MSDKKTHHRRSHGTTKIALFCKTLNYAIQTYLGIQFDFTLYQNLLLYNKHYGMEWNGMKWKEMPDFAI